MIAVGSDGRSTNASALAYGTPTRYDRQVRLKVDRLYGPQYWEYARLASADGTGWRFVWDTLELVREPHKLFARSFSQGIGSAKDGRTYQLNGSPAGGGAGERDDGDEEDERDD